MTGTMTKGLHLPGRDGLIPVYYDLHLHSALSPCGDADMTPNNIVNMALLKGLSLIALTDHNSCQNCPALAEAARGKLAFIPGMELCTAEEIHIVCLFPHLEQAMDFDAYVRRRLPKIKNRPEIYGQQLIMNSRDAVIRREEQLLLVAADISFNAVPGLMQQFKGLAFPAHIDRESFSALSVLGFIPPDSGYTVVELAHPEAFLALPQQRRLAEGFRQLYNSDAHALGAIKEAGEPLYLKQANFEGLAEFFRLKAKR